LHRQDRWLAVGRQKEQPPWPNLKKTLLFFSEALNTSSSNKHLNLSLREVKDACSVSAIMAVCSERESCSDHNCTTRLPPDFNMSVLQPYKSTMRLRYDSEAHAAMVQKCLSVDEELRPEFISKTFALDGPIVVMWVKFLLFLCWDCCMSYALVVTQH
jgi:hypothetical protein